VKDFELVIFDLDGVLANTSPCHCRAYADLWRRLGIQGPAYEAIAGRPTREVVEQCAAALRPAGEQIEAWTIFKQQRAHHYLSTGDLRFADVRPCLQDLRRRGMRLALGTAASSRTAALVLRRLDLAAFFSTVVTAEDVARGKPAPDVYLEAIARCRATGASTLVVEDSRAGLEAAWAAGACMSCVRTGERLDDPRFLGSFTDLEEFLAWMETRS
jgi:HAD superfamily hydrolase (TIGR01509 family)